MSTFYITVCNINADRAYIYLTVRWVGVFYFIFFKCMPSRMGAIRSPNILFLIDSPSTLTVRLTGLPGMALTGTV